MCPPWGTPSLISASDISHVENLDREIDDEVDMARSTGCSLPRAEFMCRTRRQAFGRGLSALHGEPILRGGHAKLAWFYWM